jgi:hypothetical protein
MTYEAGPMPDPWMMLADAGCYELQSRDFATVHCAVSALTEEIDQPVVHMDW